VEEIVRVVNKSQFNIAGKTDKDAANEGGIIIGNKDEELEEVQQP
jgi:hypothetical protein